MSLISVIVPVFNVEKYLEKCVTSIINQTFTDIDIILVDDGSTDNSGKICDEFLDKDNRIQVIHKPNEGLSSARNTGIEVSKSKYIGFIDSDDYIDTNMYQTLYNDIHKYDADVAVCGVYNVFKTTKMRQPDKDGLWVFNSTEALKSVLEGNLIAAYAVNKLYKREMFYNIRYPHGKLYEDVYVTANIMALAKKVVCNSIPLYYYVRRSSSITTSRFKSSDWDMIEGHTINLEMVKKRFPQLREQALFRYFSSYIFVLDKIIFSKEQSKPEEYKRIIEILRKNAFKILSNHYFSIKRKLMIMCLCININLYSVVTLLNNEKNFELFS